MIRMLGVRALIGQELALRLQQSITGHHSFIFHVRIGHTGLLNEEAVGIITSLLISCYIINVIT